MISCLLQACICLFALIALTRAEPPVPSQSYLPQSFGTPSTSYGAPGIRGQTDAIFRSGGGPSAQYNAPRRPSSQYGAPQKPSSQYGAPSSQYGAPSSQYGAPSSEYGAPSSDYSASGSSGSGYDDGSSVSYFSLNNL